MAAPNKTLFISDLHLQASQPSITDAFFRLLAEPHTSTDALYILGDFFEAWIGDDDECDYHKQIISALKSATDKGLKIYLMHGNRDFLIGNKFLCATGCQFIADESVVDIYGKPVLLMHGDTLCTADKQYLRARKWLRHPWMTHLFLLLPLGIRKKIANKMRHASGKHMKSITLDMMDVTQTEVTRLMKLHDVSYLIHGHTHKPNTHTLTLDGKTITRIVLPAWHGKGEVLEWDAEGSIRSREI